METLIYWLLAILYYLMGCVVSIIISGMLYPVILVFPKTLILVLARKLRISALVNLLIAFLFPILFLTGCYYLINIFTSTWEIVRSVSFLTGLIGSFLITFFSGPSTRAALRADYSDFITKHIKIPEGVSHSHLLFATSFIEWNNCGFDDPLQELKSQRMNELAQKFDFDFDNEPAIRMALEFVGADTSEIEFGIDIYRSERDYAISMRELENDRIKFEKEMDDFEEYDDIVENDEEDFKERL